MITILTILAGREDILSEWAQALGNLALPEPAELLVIDNSGSGVFHTLVAEQISPLKKFERVSLIRHGIPFVIDPSKPYLDFERHSHVARLYNFAAPLVSGRLVFTVEDDTIPGPFCLTELLQLMRPGIGAVAAAYPAPMDLERPVSDPRRFLKEARMRAPEECRYVGAGCTLWDGLAFKQSFPIELELRGGVAACGWDVVLCRRIREMGLKVFLAGGISARHLVWGSARPLTVLTGFHRSGTSCLAGMLAEAGYDLGPKEKMLGAAAENQKGFYENLECLGINQRILAGCEINSDEIRRLAPWPDEVPTTIPDGLADRMRKAEVLAAKDPRFCLTLKFWRSYRRVEKVVVAVRQVEPCAASLQARGDRPPKDFGFYYGLYLRSLADTIGGGSCCVVTFDDMLMRPHRVLERLEEYLGVPLNIESGSKFPDPWLRHSSGGEYTPPVRRLLSRSIA